MPIPLSLTSISTQSPSGLTADADTSAVRRELDRVLDQVPEDLLESGRIAVDPVRRARPNVYPELQSPCFNVGLADLDCPVDDST